MVTSRTSLFAFALLATSACSGKSADEDTGRGDPPPPTDCYPATGMMAEAVPECGASKVCLPEDAGVVIDDASCVEPYCRFASGGTTLSFNDDSTSVSLMFHSPLTPASTTEELAAAFVSVEFSVRFPVEPARELPYWAIHRESRTGIEAFDAIELRDGRLHLRLVFTISNPTAGVSSSDSSCFVGDVGGYCPCTYGGVAREGSIEIDLPAGII